MQNGFFREDCGLLTSLRYPDQVDRWHIRLTAQSAVSRRRLITESIFSMSGPLPCSVEVLVSVVSDQDSLADPQFAKRQQRIASRSSKCRFSNSPRPCGLRSWTRHPVCLEQQGVSSRHRDGVINFSNVSCLSSARSRCGSRSEEHHEVSFTVVHRSVPGCRAQSGVWYADRQSVIASREPVCGGQVPPPS